MIKAWKRKRARRKAAEFHSRDWNGYYRKAKQVSDMRLNARNAYLKNCKPQDAAILGLLAEPSEREIGRALNLPKTTVHEALVRLRMAGFTTGEWSL